MRIVLALIPGILEGRKQVKLLVIDMDILLTAFESFSSEDKAHIQLHARIKSKKLVLENVMTLCRNHLN